MKIIKFINKNYKRLIIQVVSIVSAFVIFSFSASADTFDYSVDMPISQPPINDNTCYVEVLYNGGVSVEVDMFSIGSKDSSFTGSPPSIGVLINANEIWFYCDSSDFYFDCFWMTSAGNCGFLNSRAYNDGQKIEISYNNVVGVKIYGNMHFVVGTNSLPNQYTWNVNYSTDAVAKNQLNTIIGLLQSQNSSNNQINESVEQSADKISGSISESTNEIINGGSDKPEVDSSGVDKHNETEQQITEATQNGITSAKDMFKQDHLKIFQGFGNGLMGASEVINSFVSWPWLGDIIDLSMIFGMFAFIVGMSLMVMGSQRGKK